MVQGGHAVRHSFNTLMRRLSKAGFKRQFVKTALIPEWWEDSYAKDSAVLPEVEIRVARFLNTPMATVRNVEAALTPPSYKGAQLRRVRDLSRDRLGPAIHTATRVAEAVIRNLRHTGPAETPLPDALEWRRILTSGEHGPVQLDDILGDLWARGIPVIPLDILPAPGFQGMACVLDERPVIVLGQKYDEPGRVAVFVAHEAGHIAGGDCSPGTPVLDEDNEVRDCSTMEIAAERFATLLMVGKGAVPIPEGELDAKELAQLAYDLESQSGADASLIIYTWAAKTLNYPCAAMAVKALYRSAGARRQVRRLFDQHVDTDSASESDRCLLRCVYGEQQPTAVVG